MSKRVYLAGPISGLTYGECTSWREDAIEYLNKYGIIGVSPMRCREGFGNGQIIFKPDESDLGNSKSIITRDRYDITQNCDLMLVNFLGAKTISLGTCVEYGWADAMRKPIVTIMEVKGNPHDQSFIRETTGFRVETLQRGLSVVVSILNP